MRIHYTKMVVWSDIASVGSYPTGDIGSRLKKVEVDTRCVMLEQKKRTAPRGSLNAIAPWQFGTVPMSAILEK